MNPNYPSRISIAHLPTPIEPLEKLSEFLGGPEIFIKRDDQTGLAFGGNKTRKLEFLVADALAKDCDHLVTSGDLQSNHCRQTAAAAARYGLGCSLIIRGEPQSSLNGNLLLDKILGANLYWSRDQSTSEIISNVNSELRSSRLHPYLIPRGGSNAIGAAGYVLAMQEFMAQVEQQQLTFDTIIFASSSGGTQAGLILGAKVYGYNGRMIGMSIEHPANEFKARIAALTIATASHLGVETESLSEMIEINDNYLGGGYGVIGETERESIRTLAQLEGILLDPVYTGRAMGGLIDLIRGKDLHSRQRILFWHTGGTPALFAYQNELF